MKQQRRRQGIALAITAMAAMLLALPGAAFAEKADRHDREGVKKERRHRGDDRTARHSGHDHGRHTTVHDARRDLREVRSDLADAKRNLKAARSDRRDDRRHVKQHRHHREHVRDENPGKRKHAERAVFYCKPCSRQFGTQQELFGHAHRRHRTAYRRFSRHFVKRGLSWTFYG